MKKKLMKATGVLGMASTILITGLATDKVYAGKDVGYYGYETPYVISYGGDRHTSYRMKYNAGANGVVNMNQDTGSAWVQHDMKDERGAIVAPRFYAQRGTRVTFRTGKAKIEELYRLSISKRYPTGVPVAIKGRWSPDE